MNQIFYKKSDSRSSVGMSARAVLKMAMLFAIIVASLGVMNPIEVKAQCPPRGPADCEDYNYGGMVTIEHPAGSGCFLNFSYCYRNNCDGELEVLITGLYFFTTTNPCPPPVVNTDLYMECLDAVINILLPHIGYGPEIPPCDTGTTFRVYLYHYSCQTAWMPHFISCDNSINYNKERCDTNGDGMCVSTVEYCWDDVHPVYTLKGKLVKTEFYGNVDCKRKNFLFIDYIWVSQNTCLGQIAEQKKQDFLNMFRNGPCRGLTGKAFEECVAAECAADTTIFFDFLRDLLIYAAGCDGCDLSASLVRIKLIHEKFPDGNIGCDPTCD